MGDKDQAEFDERISQYIEATERLKQGDFDVMLSFTPADELGRLGQSLLDLAKTLESRYRQLKKLVELTSDINAGLLLDNILDKVYDNFKAFIPYNRIGFSLIEENRDEQRVRAYWAKTDQPVVKLPKGYSASLQGSSLETIIRTGQPRIINDLTQYLADKPSSESTRLVVAEGMRSSLTCPLIANGVAVGFMFFSSIQPNVYATVHIDIFQSIASQLSVIVEKGRLVTELAEQKAAIEKQNKELRRLDELKNTFLGMAAHDLRGPLGNIQMGAEVLLEMRHALSPAEEYKILKDTTHQTAHMLVLINDLLDVAQIESGKLELRAHRIDLYKFMAEAVSRHAQAAVSKNSRVVLQPAQSGYIQVDPIRLRQVVDNLLSNAIKYSPPDSTITVTLRPWQEGWQVRVQDQGPGITPADRKRLFTDFARLSAKPTGGEKSTGLGLAIARRIVEAHGGKIDVDSTPGQGATFWFWLPQIDGS